MFKIGDLVKITQCPFGSNGLLAIVTETHYAQAYKVVRVLILKTNLHDNYHPSRLEAV
jgi:transcription antitermination factor NusG